MASFANSPQATNTLTKTPLHSLLAYFFTKFSCFVNSNDAVAQIEKCKNIVWLKCVTMMFFTLAIIRFLFDLCTSLSRSSAWSAVDFTSLKMFLFDRSIARFHVVNARDSSLNMNLAVIIRTLCLVAICV